MRTRMWMSMRVRTGREVEVGAAARRAAPVTCALGALGAVAALVLLAACGKKDASPSGSNTPPAAGAITAASSPDTDVAAHGSAIPRGYVAQPDRADASLSAVGYAQKEPGRWEVRTGPAHLLYMPSDTAAGKYTATATFEQLEAPAHPEAYGIFIGGSGLDQPATRKYTYFIVRGDGKYAVKARNGTDVRSITDWTASPAVPRQDAAGKGLYGIRVESDGKTARVSVNGAPVTTITAKDGPIAGVVGVRINHNLHLIVTPAAVIR